MGFVKIKYRENSLFLELSNRTLISLRVETFDSSIFNATAIKFKGIKRNRNLLKEKGQKRIEHHTQMQKICSNRNNR